MQREKWSSSHAPIGEIESFTIISTQGELKKYKLQHLSEGKGMPIQIVLQYFGLDHVYKNNTV